MRSLIIFHCNFYFFKNTSIQNSRCAISPPTNPRFLASCWVQNTLECMSNWERTYDSQHGTGWVLVQGGVHDAGVGALISICHVFDGQTVHVHHKPDNRGSQRDDAFNFPRSYITVCFFFGLHNKCSNEFKWISQGLCTSHHQATLHCLWARSWWAGGMGHVWLYIRTRRSFLSGPPCTLAASGYGWALEDVTIKEPILTNNSDGHLT